MDKIRVALLYGGSSYEHEVALRSALAIYENLSKDTYDVLLIGIGKDGSWHLQRQPRVTATEKFGRILEIVPDSEGTVLLDLNRRIFLLKEGAIFTPEVVFPVIHGTTGEDGAIQGLCRFLDIPCVGSNVLGSVIAMDKILTKKILSSIGIPVVDYIEVLKTDFAADRASIVQTTEQQLGFPVFVKPSSLGSSIGVSKADGRSELITKIEGAFIYGEKVVIERAIKAREIECAVLEDENGSLLVSEPGEIIHNSIFYDYDAKYSNPNLRLEIPAKIPQDITTQIKRYARDAFRIMGLSGMARMDFFLGPDGRIYFNEANTIPGFTEVSMYPKLLEYSGIGFSSILDELIKVAMKRKAG